MKAEYVSSHCGETGMPPRDPTRQLDTHEVTNQPPPLVDYNLYDCDSVLRGAARWRRTLATSPAKNSSKVKGGVVRSRYLGR